MRKIKAVLFDFDGTIADSLALTHQILETNLKKELPKSEIKKFQKKSASDILKDLELSFFNGFYLLWKIKREINKKADQISLFPKVKNLLKILKKEGFLLGVLSNNKKKTIVDVLEKNNITQFDYISGNIFSFDKKRKLKKFLKKYKLKPEEVVYIGDQITDIVDAKKVNLNTIAVDWGFDAKELLIRENPDFLATSVEDIFIWLDLKK